MSMRKLNLPKLSKRAMRRFDMEMKHEKEEYEKRVRWLGKRMTVFPRLTPMEQYEVAAYLVGDFGGGDGYAFLVYADGASHKMKPEGCKPKGQGNHSCHLHLGLVGETPYNAFMPKHRRWSHGRCFCGQGKTRDRAIILALTLAGLRK